MKKLLTISILTYLLFTINSIASTQNFNENNSEKGNILKVGILLPLTGAVLCLDGGRHGADFQSNACG